MCKLELAACEHFKRQLFVSSLSIDAVLVTPRPARIRSNRSNIYILAIRELLKMWWLKGSRNVSVIVTKRRRSYGTLRAKSVRASNTLLATAMQT